MGKGDVLVAARMGKLGVDESKQGISYNAKRERSGGAIQNERSMEMFLSNVFEFSS